MHDYLLSPEIGIGGTLMIVDGNLVIGRGRHPAVRPSQQLPSAINWPII